MHNFFLTSYYYYSLVSSSEDIHLTPYNRYQTQETNETHPKYYLALFKSLLVVPHIRFIVIQDALYPSVAHAMLILQMALEVVLSIALILAVLFRTNHQNLVIRRC